MVLARMISEDIRPALKSCSRRVALESAEPWSQVSRMVSAEEKGGMEESTTLAKGSTRADMHVLEPVLAFAESLMLTGVLKLGAIQFSDRPLS